jgi:Ca2+-binding RTX toxin-like protein
VEELVGTYVGTSSNDTITTSTLSPGVSASPAGTLPSSGPDSLYGKAGNDSLNGGDGDDHLEGNEGRDTVYGGGGNDYLYEVDDSSASNYLDGGAGNDTIASYLSIDTMVGGTGNDTYYVYNSGDQVTESASAGTDTVNTWLNYVIPVNVENATLQYEGLFNNGPVSCTGNSASNLIIGNVKDNSLQGGGGNDSIFGDGPDAEEGSGGNDVIDGGDGDDHLEGEDGNDTLYGGTGNDYFYEIDRADSTNYLDGGSGNDTFAAYLGIDTMVGGTGNDTYDVYNAGDRVVEAASAGTETVRTWVDYVIPANVENVVLQYEGLFGNGPVSCTGNGLANRMTGNLKGNTLQGGAGNDTLFGGEGIDQLWGQGGDDVFDYDGVSDSRPGGSLRDVINDFVGVGASSGDRVDLNAIDANTAVAGNQNFTFRGTSAFSAPGQIRVAASGSDTLIQANVTGNTGAELEILAKDGGALASQWVAGDFIL